MRAHLKSLAAAGVGGVLTYCSAPTVATIDPSRAAVKEGLVAAAGGSATTTAAAGRQLLQQQQARATAATATTATTPASTSSIRVVPAERPTNASALANLVAQAAVLGMGVGFVVPEYRHRNARTVRDDLRWCLEVAQGAVRGSAQARGALAARPPAARRAQPLAPLLSHEGRAVFLVRSAASIPCHHWTALLKPGGAFSVREREVGAGEGEEDGGGGEGGFGEEEEERGGVGGDGPRRLRRRGGRRRLPAEKPSCFFYFFFFEVVFDGVGNHHKDLGQERLLLLLLFLLLSAAAAAGGSPASLPPIFLLLCRLLSGIPGRLLAR